jgi:hypothetical protein
MWCALYLLCLIIVGYAVAARLARGRSALETVGLALCAGPGIMGLALIAISFSGFKPTRLIIFAITLLAAATLAIPCKFAKPPARACEEEDRTPRWWLAVCILALGYSTTVVATDTFVYPTIEWDAFSIWQLKSKFLATGPLTPRPAYFTDISRSYSHLKYPILVSMISAGEHAMSGRIDDELEKSPEFLLYLGLGAAVFAAVARRRGYFAAITATTLLMTTSRMIVVAGNGSADLSLAVFSGCSAISLINWLEDRRTPDLILTALFTIFMTWTKQEGLPLALINGIAVLAIAAKRPKFWLTFAIVVVAAFLPWYLYTLPLPRTDENYTGHLHLSEAIGNISRLGMVLTGFVTSMCDWDNWCIFWYALPAVAVLEKQRFRQPTIKLLWALLIAHLLIYVPPYLIVANWNVRDLMGVTQNRLLLHMAPVAALLIGLHWPRMTYKSN